MAGVIDAERKAHGAKRKISHAEPLCVLRSTKGDRNVLT